MNDALKLCIIERDALETEYAEYRKISGVESDLAEKRISDLEAQNTAKDERINRLKELRDDNAALEARCAGLEDALRKTDVLARERRIAELATENGRLQRQLTYALSGMSREDSYTASQRTDLETGEKHGTD